MWLRTISVYLGLNKKPVSQDNEDVKGDARYEYKAEKTFPHPKYMENQVRQYTERNPARIFVTGIDVSQKKWDKSTGRRIISIMRISYTDRTFSLWVAD